LTTCHSHWRGPPLNTSDPTLVNYTRPEVVAAQKPLDLIDDLLGGPERMWEVSHQRSYIRKWADESRNVYNIRRQIEELFEGFKRVLSAGVGMLFAKPLQIDYQGSETAMTPIWENIDGRGTAGPVFAKYYANADLKHGYGIILVDHPPSPGDPTSKDEATLNLRPMVALYSRRQVINWFHEVIDNVQTLTLLVLQESAAVRTGSYGIESVQQYRVLRLGEIVNEKNESMGRGASWELWREAGEKQGGTQGFKRVGRGVFLNRNGKLCPRIPVAGDYDLVKEPPLRGVAYANLGHWRQATNLRFYKEVAAFPQPVVTGQLAQESDGQGGTQPGKLKMGPMVWIHVQGEGASVTYAAPPTEAFQPLEQGIKEKLEQMGQLGQQFLISDTRAAETAAAHRLDAAAENSTLATEGQAVEDVLNTMLELIAWYMGIDKTKAPTVTISKDFDATTMSPEVMTAYAALARDMGLPDMVVLKALKAGGRIPDDANLEELELEMNVNREAQRQQEEDQRSAEMERLQQRRPAA